MHAKVYRTGIGKDSHRFLPDSVAKPLVVGGVIIPGCSGLHANSDGDIVLHALCNAITSLSGILILGGIADELCFRDGITDSRVYVQEALKTLDQRKIVHVAISIEALRPKLAPYIERMRSTIAQMLSIEPAHVGITATSGEGLTECGRGAGMEAICIVTTVDY